MSHLEVDALKSYVRSRWVDAHERFGIDVGQVEVDRVETARGPVFKASIDVAGAGIHVQDVDADPFVAVRGAFLQLDRELLEGPCA